jgi:hypothetical protein
MVVFLRQHFRLSAYQPFFVRFLYNFENVAYSRFFCFRRFVSIFGILGRLRRRQFRHFWIPSCVSIISDFLSYVTHSEAA